MDFLLNFLMYSLPGGFLGSITTWLVGRRERDNDMLAKLQASINLLSEENRKILAENVQLRRENAKLQANQEVLLQKQTALLREVESLRVEITKLTNKENETFNQGCDPNAGTKCHSAHVRMLVDKDVNGKLRTKRNQNEHDGDLRHGIDPSERRQDSDEHDALGGADNLFDTGRGDCGSLRDDGTPDR